MEETMTVAAAEPEGRSPPMRPANRRAHGKRLRTALRPATRRPLGAVMRSERTGSASFTPPTRLDSRIWCRCGTAGMLQSPFTFYRGSAAVVAADLVRTPVSGSRVKVCGDCNLMNFGGFATPERRLIFDINDLDETLPAPWEWDLKRLVVSFVLAARANGLSDADGRDAAVACARSYRRKMRDFATMDVLDVWYARLDDSDFLAMLPQDRKAVLSKRIAKATAASSSELVFPKLAEKGGGQARIHDTPPTLFHAE